MILCCGSSAIACRAGPEHWMTPESDQQRAAAEAVTMDRNRPALPWTATRSVTILSWRRSRRIVSALRSCELSDRNGRRYKHRLFIPLGNQERTVVGHSG